MAYTPDQILKKVQKLLKLADNDGAAEGERDNAMRMAHKLLAKYNLDLADVETAKQEDKRATDGEPREEHTNTFFGRPWARDVCQSIAQLFFCHYLYTSHKNKHRVKHYFIGRRSNAITAALIAEFVVQSILSEGNRQKRLEMEGNPWLRSFCWGAAHKVQDRVSHLIEGDDESQTEDEPGTALVLASYYEREREANQQLVQALYPRLGRGRGGKEYSTGSGAYDRGKAYGASVSLNRQVQ